MARGVGEYFGTLAERYDSVARRGMPRRDEMLAKIVEVTPTYADDILELGCGTGALTALLSERYPRSTILALDGASEMVELAKERLDAAKRGAEVTLEVQPFEELELPRQRYDLIASNMSLHHVKDKVPFYAKLWEALRPDGLLVFGDELKGVLPYVEELHWNGWLEFARQPGGLTEREIAEIVAHAETEDHYETLPDQLKMLRSGGFVQIDCTWRYLNYGVFVASVQ